MTDKSLAELYAAHTGKATDKWASYLEQYDRLFAPYRDRPVSILEIGIQNGGSLDIWASYFPRAQRIIGCDINENCRLLEYTDSRIDVVVGDANQDDTQAAILALCDSFDIVIDDGSHLSSDIIKSFARYYPRIKEDGLFIAEDLHCSYWRDFEGGLYDPYSSISFFKSLADVVNFEHWGLAKTTEEFLRGFGDKYSLEFDAQIPGTVGSVEFMNSITSVRKCAPGGNLLGERHIAGEEDRAESLAEAVLGRIETHPQDNNPWAALDLSPAEELEKLRGSHEQLEQGFEYFRERAEQQIASLEQHGADLELANQTLKSSWSWRITAPLRALSSLFSGSPARHPE